jgi:hypothetical protein
VIWAIDFDGVVVVEEGRAYDDVTTPLELMPGCREALLALKRAGHLLVLFSGRSNRARMYMPDFDPLVATGHVAPHHSPELHAARFKQMLEFVERELPGVFDAVDDGRQGKPVANVYLDDSAISFGGPNGVTWGDIADLYGE